MATSRLVESLAEVCQDYLLNEKWLLAPSRRVGHQWLDAVTRTGQPVVNVHVKTVRSLTLDLASPAIASNKLRLLTGRATEMLVDRVFRNLKRHGLTYLGELEPSTGLTQTLHRTIRAVRLAGLDVANVSDDRFEVSEKAEDLRKIIAAYLGEQQRTGWIDYAEAVRFAIQALQNHRPPLADDVLLLVAEDLRFQGIESTLLNAFPDAQRLTLPVDQPIDEQSSAKSTSTDLALLRWLPRPTEAPAPADDKTVKLFHAMGEVNEVREILRRLVAETIPFDEAELLYTDSETYVPLIYETLASVVADDGNMDDELPVTCADGVPVRFFRPGRLLRAWIFWIRDGFPQSGLVSIVREGLITVPALDQADCSYSRLATLLRTVGIGFGKDRYLVKLDESIAALQRQLRDAAEHDEDGDERRRRLRLRRLEDLKLLHSLVQAMLDASPSPQNSQSEILDCAIGLLEKLARTVNKSDNFARQRLLEEMAELRTWLDDASDFGGIDVYSLLTDLPHQARILGSGPRPGCLHVANLSNGGHSGRRHTFVVGLDDGRFPGGGSQDPLLLDRERHRISSELPTAAAQLAEKVTDFYRLVARLRGEITMSFSSHDLVDNRAKFPSSQLLSVWRIVSGHRDGSQEDFVTWLPRPVSFAPTEEGYFLTVNDWWLHQLCVGEPVQDADELILASYPHLARGREAIRHRSSPEFTMFDGQVEQAGRDLDPTREEGPVMSGHRLEMIGQCPLKFFFRYGLGIEPPEELEVDPTRWLDALAAGTLLHEVFEQFMRERVELNELPQWKHLKSLTSILETRAREYRDLYPPLNEHLYDAQMDELHQVIRTFLNEEVRYCRDTGNRPAYLEASLGMQADKHGAAIDTEKPIPIGLPDGSTFHVRGRVDRIDRIGGGAVGSYVVWDYKTGSAWKFRLDDPFREGRVVQPALYVAMVGHRLKEIEKDQTVDVARFGFFFPGNRERGKRIEWSSAQLSESPQLLSRLVQIVRNGAFIATNNHEDCRFCDYQCVCGDVKTLATKSTEKLGKLENTVLDPFRELRSYGNT